MSKNLANLQDEIQKQISFLTIFVTLMDNYLYFLH